MSARIRRVARDGDPSGQDYSGRSEAAQAIVTAWANHEAASRRPLDPTRIPTDLRTLLLDSRCGGGRYYRERGLPGSAGIYLPRNPADTDSRLDHDWRRAAELVTTRPAVADHSTARLEIAEIRAALDDQPKRWAGQAGPTDRVALEFLLAKSRHQHRRAIHARHPSRGTAAGDDQLETVPGSASAATPSRVTAYPPGGIRT